MNAKVRKVTIHNKGSEQAISSIKVYNANNSKNNPFTESLYFELLKVFCKSNNALINSEKYDAL